MTRNTLLYADDIVLLANDRHSMQKMLNIVDEFGKKKYINPSSFLQIDGPSNQLNQLDDKINLKLNNKIIAQVRSIKHLGCIINTSLTGMNTSTTKSD